MKYMVITIYIGLMVIIYSVVENCVAQAYTSLLSDITQKTNDFLENVTKTSALGLILMGKSTNSC